MSNIQGQATDLYREGLNAAANMMSVTVEEADRLRNSQLSIINLMLTESAGLTARICSTRTLGDVMTVYATLAETPLKSISACWSEIRHAIEPEPAIHKYSGCEDVLKNFPLLDARDPSTSSKESPWTQFATYDELARAAQLMANLAPEPAMTATRGDNVTDERKSA